MATENRLSRMITPLTLLPHPLRQVALSAALGRVVKFVGTAGLTVEELTTSRATISVQNRRKVQNHIGGVHAAAMALIAETATGFVVGMNVPDTAVPVIKSMHVDFKKRAKGGLRAIATLDDYTKERIRTEERGEVNVPVTVTDESGESPILCEMIWAWTPKRR